MKFSKEFETKQMLFKDVAQGEVLFNEAHNVFMNIGDYLDEYHEESNNAVFLRDGEVTDFPLDEFVNVCDSAVLVLTGAGRISE